MLIAIILCLFSVAFGAPYYIRLDGLPVPAVGNAGSLSVGAVPNNPYASLYGYNTVPAYNLPYNRDYFYGSQGAYAPQYQQGYQVPVSGLQYIVPNVANVGSVQPQVENEQSVQNVQHVGQIQVPSNVEFNGQDVIQSVGDVNSALQSIGLVQNVDSVGVAPQFGVVVPVLVPNSLPIGTFGAPAISTPGKYIWTRPLTWTPPVTTPSVKKIAGEFVDIIKWITTNPMPYKRPVPEFLKPYLTLQEYGQNLNPQFINRGYSQQIPVVSVRYAANIETPTLSDPLQPTGYSQQLPVVSNPNVRNVDKPVESNVSVGSKMSGNRPINRFVSSGLVGALGAGGRSTIIHK